MNEPVKKEEIEPVKKEEIKPEGAEDPVVEPKTVSPPAKKEIAGGDKDKAVEPDVPQIASKELPVLGDKFKQCPKLDEEAPV